MNHYTRREVVYQGSILLFALPQGRLHLLLVLQQAQQRLLRPLRIHQQRTYPLVILAQAVIGDLQLAGALPDQSFLLLVEEGVAQRERHDGRQGVEQSQRGVQARIVRQTEQQHGPDAQAPRVERNRLGQLESFRPQDFAGGGGFPRPPKVRGGQPVNDLVETVRRRGIRPAAAACRIHADDTVFHHGLAARALDEHDATSAGQFPEFFGQEFFLFAGMIRAAEDAAQQVQGHRRKRGVIVVSAGFHAGPSVEPSRSMASSMPTRKVSSGTGRISQGSPQYWAHACRSLSGNGSTPVSR